MQMKVSYTKNITDTGSEESKSKCNSYRAHAAGRLADDSLN